GKSSILDATVIMLSWAVNRIKHSGSSGKPITENDIKNGASFSTIELETSAAKWKIVKARKGHGTPEEKSDYTDLNRFSKYIQSQIADNHPISLPLFVYYPINRAVIDIPLRIKNKHNFDVLSAYDDALGGGANFRTFFEWFREREDLENENNANSIVKTTDKSLDAVRMAWELFLPEFKNFRVRRSPLRLEVEKNGKKLSVNQLSDGEKVLLSMIGDLSRRLSIANPNLSNPLDGEAIVLIDEIDLHLHPKWQRMVIEKFPSVFTKCQFIMTTHSPHIITHTRAENLFRLKQIDMKVTCEKPIESYGKNVDRILEDLMGLDTTRPNGVKKYFDEIYDLIDKNDFALAKEKIISLKNDIGEDSDLLKAELLIRRKEVIGK
ncbi:MAG: AAA family ATPase, partial [Rhodobacterales bacterium]|nr:AAA family ATPase [Rhodobacterales bacterium]